MFQYFNFYTENIHEQQHDNNCKICLIDVECEIEIGQDTGVILLVFFKVE